MNEKSEQPKDYKLIRDESIPEWAYVDMNLVPAADIVERELDRIMETVRNNT